MTVNYIPQAIKPIDDGSPNSTASKTNINDALTTLTANVTSGANALSMGIHPGYVAGRWYSLVDCATTNAAVAAADILYLFPFQVLAPVTIASMLMRVTTGGTGSTVKSAIWANSTVSMRPLGVPLYSDNTGVATTSSSTNVSLAVAGALTPGLYWFGSKHTGTLPTVQCIGSSGAPPSGLFRWTGIPTAAATFPSLGFGISIADTYSNNIAATTLAEGASFTHITSAIVPNAAIVT